MTRRLLVALLAAAAASGCGYRVQSYPGHGSEDRQRVAVAQVANEGFDPGYEFVVSDAMRKEILRRGALRLVDDPLAADMVLRGTIRDIRTRSRSFSSIVLSLEYQVVVRMELEVLLGQGEEQEALGVDNRMLVERDLYLASADIEATRKNRTEALRRVADILAARIHDTVYELAP